METDEAIHRALHPGPGMGGAASKPPANLTAGSHDHPRLSLTSPPVQNGREQNGREAKQLTAVKSGTLFLSIMLGAEDI